MWTMNEKKLYLKRVHILGLIKAVNEYISNLQPDLFEK